VCWAGKFVAVAQGGVVGKKAAAAAAAAACRLLHGVSWCLL